MGSLPVSKFIQNCLVLYLIAWTISPPLQIDMIYRVLALGAAALWFILNMPYNVKLERIHILAIVFILLVVFVALIEGKGDLEAILRPINYYMLVLAFLMAYCYEDRWDELSALIPIVMILLIYFNFKTYQVIIDDPAVARLIVRNDSSIYHYMRQGVGGYGLLYPQVCVLPMFVSWTLSSFKKHKIKFAIGVLWIVSYTMYLLNSGYTIAVVVSIASLIILFFYKRKDVTLAIVIVSILLVLLVWLIGYVDGFRNALLNFFDGTTVAKKINDIYLSITTDETADSIMVRIEAYVDAINTILRYPLIGGLWWSGGGGHSAILDTFAKYGIFGGYIFLNMVFGFPTKLKKQSADARNYKLANAFLIAVLFITLLNSLPYNMVFLIIIVAHVCYNNISNWRNENENSLDGKLNTDSGFTTTTD